MPEDMNLPDDLRATEKLLRQAVPNGTAFNRDQVMYEAGRGAALRAGRVRLRIWQGACAVTLLACAVLAAFPRNRAADSRLVNEQPPVAAPAPTITGNAPQVVAVADSGNAGVSASGSLPEFWQAAKALGSLTTEHAAGLSARLEDPGNMGSGSGGRYLPTLHRSEGLDGLPQWQKQAAIFGGNRS